MSESELGFLGKLRMQYHRIVRLGALRQARCPISEKVGSFNDRSKPRILNASLPAEMERGCLIGLLAAFANPIKTQGVPSSFPSRGVASRDLDFRFVHSVSARVPPNGASNPQRGGVSILPAANPRPSRPALSWISAMCHFCLYRGLVSRPSVHSWTLTAVFLRA